MNNQKKNTNEDKIPQFSLDFQEHTISISSHLPQILFPKDASHVKVSQTRNPTINNYHIPNIERIKSVKSYLNGEDLEFVSQSSYRKLNNNNEQSELNNLELNQSVLNDKESSKNIKDSEPTQNKTFHFIADECRATTSFLTNFLFHEVPFFDSKLENELKQLQAKLKEESLEFEKSLKSEWKKRKDQLVQDFNNKIQELKKEELDQKIRDLKLNLKTEEEELQILSAKK